MSDFTSSSDATNYRADREIEHKDLATRPPEWHQESDYQVYRPLYWMVSRHVLGETPNRSIVSQINL
jgi:hypothetical protein